MEQWQKDCVLKFKTSLKDMLLSIRDDFKQHKILFQTKLAVQRNILNHVSVLGRRFSKLTSDPFPRAQWDLEEEQKIQKEFQTIKDQLSSSNSELDASCKDLQNTCEALKSDLDKIIGPRTEGICECAYYIKHCPILQHIEEYSTYFTYYQAVMGKTLEMMVVDNAYSILFYKDLLEPKEIMDATEFALNKAVNEFNN